MGRKKSNKRIKELFLAVIIIILLVVAEKIGLFQYIDKLFGESELSKSIKASLNITSTQEVKKENDIVTTVADKINIAENKLNILFLDVGQADSQSIICDSKVMLIDAGNAKDGEKIVDGLKALGISKIDYVIGTHVHEDHIGGMSYIIEAFDIGEFYLPYNVNNTSNYYKRLLTSLSNKELSISEATVGNKKNLGTANFEIMSVDNSEPENANLSSIVIQLSYGNKNYLFMGDAESENEKARDWNDIDVLKVGHHGSLTSSSNEFLKQVLPEIAIISVGKDNSYGLPKDKIIDRISNLGTTIYRTDYDGTIQLISDGNINEIVKIELSFDGNE